VTDGVLVALCMIPVACIGAGILIWLAEEPDPRNFDRKLPPPRAEVIDLSGKRRPFP